MKLRPYRVFPHVPQACATLWFSSARSGNPRSYLTSNFFCFSGVSGLIPTTLALSFFKSGSASRSEHDCVVHPGVSAFG